MRGKVPYVSVATCSQGITPAYAGKRNHGIKVVAIDEDHPRLCGEKQRAFRSNLKTIGSPPPMRGKVNFSAQVLIRERITPAYAGKRPVRSICGR